MLTMRGKTLSELAIRSRARRRGLEVKKSRGGIHGNNLGHYMVVNPRNAVVLGGRFDASLEEIAGYLADIEPGRDFR